MILAEATRRSVIKDVIAECKTDDSERLIRSGGFGYEYQIMAEAMLQMVTDAVRTGSLLVRVGGLTVCWFWCDTSDGSDTCYDEK
jgi:hypothetical protein